MGLGCDRIDQRGWWVWVAMGLLGGLEMRSCGIGCELGTDMMGWGENWVGIGTQNRLILLDRC